jgi:hypothetical protein
MGRTIPSFRIAAVLEKEKWKLLENISEISMRKNYLYMCYQLQICITLLVLMLLFHSYQNISDLDINNIASL